MTSDHSSLDDLSYEQARTELESVIADLDDPELPLDDMMALWERGEALATLCEQRLEGARQRFDEVTRNTSLAKDSATDNGSRAT